MDLNLFTEVTRNEMKYDLLEKALYWSFISHVDTNTPGLEPIFPLTTGPMWTGAGLPIIYHSDFPVFFCLRGTSSVHRSGVTASIRAMDVLMSESSGTWSQTVDRLKEWSVTDCFLRASPDNNGE